MTVLPLLCIVCENPVFSEREWVKAGPSKPIYGLHDRCIASARIRGWNADGSPDREPSLEERVERLEKRLAPPNPWGPSAVGAGSSRPLRHFPPCGRCLRGDPLPHRAVYSR